MFNGNTNIKELINAAPDQNYTKHTNKDKKNHINNTPKLKKHNGELFCKNLKGCTWTIPVKNGESILSVKNKLEDGQYAKSNHYLSLIFQGKEYNNDYIITPNLFKASCQFTIITKEKSKIEHEIQKTIDKVDDKIDTYSKRSIRNYFNDPVTQDKKNALEKVRNKLQALQNLYKVGEGKIRNQDKTEFTRLKTKYHTLLKSFNNENSHVNYYYFKAGLFGMGPKSRCQQRINEASELFNRAERELKANVSVAKNDYSIA